MSEVDLVGITTTPSQVLKSPRLIDAHAALECREYPTIEIGRSMIITGAVLTQPQLLKVGFERWHVGDNISVRSPSL
jgi:hypothetical protein